MIIVCGSYPFKRYLLGLALLLYLARISPVYGYWRGLPRLVLAAHLVSCVDTFPSLVTNWTFLNQDSVALAQIPLWPQDSEQTDLLVRADRFLMYYDRFQEAVAYAEKERRFESERGAFLKNCQIFPFIRNEVATKLTMTSPNPTLQRLSALWRQLHGLKSNLKTASKVLDAHTSRLNTLQRLYRRVLRIKQLGLHPISMEAPGILQLAAWCSFSMDLNRLDNQLQRMNADFKHISLQDRIFLVRLITTIQRHWYQWGFPPNSTHLDVIMNRCREAQAVAFPCLEKSTQQSLASYLKTLSPNFSCDEHGLHSICKCSEQTVQELNLVQLSDE